MEFAFRKLLFRTRLSLASRLYGLIAPGGDRPVVRYDPRRSVSGSPRRRRVFFDVQEHCCLEAFWKELGGDAFAGASLYLFDYEVLRFDCSGAGAGHYHVFPLERTGLGSRGRKRLWFHEPTAEEQIERTVFELARNAAYHLQRSRYRDIRHFVLDEVRLGEAAASLKAQCLAFLANAGAGERAPAEYPEAGSAR